MDFVAGMTTELVPGVTELVCVSSELARKVVLKNTELTASEIIAQNQIRPRRFFTGYENAVRPMLENGERRSVALS